MQWSRVLAVVAVVAMGIVVVRAQGNRLVENCGSAGKIDWSAGRLYVKGEGLPKKNTTGAKRRLTAKQAAKDKAYAECVGVIHGVAVDNVTLTVNSVTKWDVIITKMAGLVDDAIVYDKQSPLLEGLGFTGVGWDAEEGVFTVVIEVPITGEQSLASVVLPVVTQPNYQPANPPAPAEHLDSPAPAGEPALPEKATGLIVDGSATDVAPAMNAKLYEKESKQEIYGTASLDTDTAIRRGVVGYATSVDAARQSTDRVGKSPMVVPASGAVGRRALSVSGKDAQAVREADQRDGFLKQCNVLFVLKEPK